MIDLGFRSNDLYTARRLTINFEDNFGTPRTATGTGFLVGRVQAMDQPVFLVTNRHVVDPYYAEDTWRGSTVTSLQIDGWDGSDSEGVLPQKITVTSPKFTFSSTYDVDVACLMLQKGPHADRIQMEGFGRVNRWWPIAHLATESDFQDGTISAGDWLVTPGFPIVGESQTDRPVLSSGILASDPRFSAKVSVHPNAMTMYTQTFSREGASGSAVIALNRGALIYSNPSSASDYRPQCIIGVNGGHVPSTSQEPGSFSYCFQSTTVLTILESICPGVTSFQ